MAFLGSLLGIMGQLGRVVPNYVQGYRQAWQDNWNDANQYNQVQRGQLANLFAEAAFPYEYNMLADRAAMSRAQANQSVGNFRIYAENYPWLQDTSRINALWGPTNAWNHNYWNNNPGTQAAVGALNQDYLYSLFGVRDASQIGSTLFNQNMQRQAQAQAQAQNQAYWNYLSGMMNNQPQPQASVPSTPPSYQQVWESQQQRNVP